VRLLAGLVAGQQTGTIVLTEEFDDLAAYGVYHDKVLVNGDIRAMMSSSPENPVTGFQTSLFIDVPL
jgi:hypothetical protein